MTNKTWQTPSVTTLKFAEKHGYKYAGKGWFLYIGKEKNDLYDPIVQISQTKKDQNIWYNEL